MIRDAETADLRALARLWHDGWHDAHAAILPADLTRARTPESFLARLTERRAGVRALGPVGAPLGFHLIGGDELNQFYVAAEARGTDAAAALMADAEARLRAAGVATAWLACAIGNDRAARFYEKSGWRNAGVVPIRLETGGGVFEVEIWRFERTLARIRPFEPKDAGPLGALFHAAVHGVGAQHYSPEQAAAWSPRPPAAERALGRAADGRLFLVAVDMKDEGDDAPLAYGDLEADGHIDHLYCRPDAAGTGVTLALYRALETQAVRQGIRRLYTEASEPARRFFLKRGFAVTARRDFEIGGVRIHNYAMEKPL